MLAAKPPRESDSSEMAADATYIPPEIAPEMAAPAMTVPRIAGARTPALAITAMVRTVKTIAVFQFESRLSHQSPIGFLNQNSPVGSVYLRGLFTTYAYRFRVCGIPREPRTGSFETKRPRSGS